LFLTCRAGRGRFLAVGRGGGLGRGGWEVWAERWGRGGYVGWGSGWKGSLWVAG